VKPVNYRGSFSASDPELTRIWYTGAYTVKLCLQKDYFGAILWKEATATHGRVMPTRRRQLLWLLSEILIL
jgi:hypothetical protein